MPKIKIDDIKVIRKYSPRLKMNSDAVERYMDAFRVGEHLPPLAVQKEKLILIDGFHRYEALKELGKEEVEVELVDIPESEIRAEAVRRNRKHGIPLTREERDNDILLFRQEGRSIKEIAEIFGITPGRVSQVLRKFNFKKAKTDLRRKLTAEDYVKIITDNRKVVDIAHDFGISPARVSQIKTSYEPPEDRLVTIIGEAARLDKVLRISLWNLALTSSWIRCRKEGLYIVNFDPDQYEIALISFISKDYFHHYDIKGEEVMYCHARDLRWIFKNIEYREEYGQLFICPDRVVVQVGNIRWEFKSKILGQKVFPFVNIWQRKDDILSLPEKVVLDRKVFDRMPGEGIGTIELNEGKLTISGVLPNEWRISKTIEDEKFKGKGRASFRFEHLKRIISPPFWGRYNPVTLFFLRDDALALYKVIWGNEFFKRYPKGFLMAFLTVSRAQGLIPRKRKRRKS